MWEISVIEKKEEIFLKLNIKKYKFKNYYFYLDQHLIAILN
jgi:hypothetical protein